MCVGLLVYDLVFVGIRIEMYGVAGEMCVTGTGRPAKAESTGHFFFVCVCVCVWIVRPRVVGCHAASII
jgi:hypothetical protein